MFAVNQLSRVMFRPSKAHMAAAEHSLRKLTSQPDQGERLHQQLQSRRVVTNSVRSLARAGEATQKINGKLISSCLILLSNAPANFKVGL